MIDIDTSRVLRDISNLLLLNYKEAVEDLYRRSAILFYAARNNLDIVSLHALARRYRRDPEKTYKEIIKSIEGVSNIEKLRDIERKIL